MRQKTRRRVAALGLVAALVAPAAWAAPGGLVRSELGGVWAAVWGWVVGTPTFSKDGLCILPDGRPGPCAPSAAPTAVPGRRPGANKEGGCIVSDGKPVCTPNAAPDLPTGRTPLATKEGGCIDPDGRQVPCKP